MLITDGANSRLNAASLKSAVVNGGLAYCRDLYQVSGILFWAMHDGIFLVSDLWKQSFIVLSHSIGLIFWLWLHPQRPCRGRIFLVYLHFQVSVCNFKSFLCLARHGPVSAGDESGLPTTGTIICWFRFCLTLMRPWRRYSLWSSCTTLASTYPRVTCLIAVLERWSAAVYVSLVSSWFQHG